MARGDKPDGSESSGVDLARLTDIGKRISRLTSSKDAHALCELLKEASGLFLIIQQQPGNDVLSALKPSMDALVLPSLLKHKDKDVQVLVASCISEILRIVAPDAPFSDEIWEEIFALIVATFKGLSDVSSPYFQVRLHILCTVASVRSCIVMLNIECNDLIHEMFQTFFATVREKPTQMMAAMKKIMCLILLENEEEIPQPLIEVLLCHLLVGRKGVSKSAYILAGAVFEECANHIKLYVEAFLKSVLLEGKSAKSKWRDVYHDLIFEIYIRAPSLVTHLIPKLRDELLAEKIDVRVKALKLLGRLFASRKGVAENFNKLFTEYLKRFNDKSVDVRHAAVECSKQCLLVNSSNSVAEDLLAALSEKIQDVDDGVRVQVVVAICNYAVSNPEKIPINILKRVAERLRDTEVHVRQETFQRLTAVYQAFCTKILEGSTVDVESFNWIPSKLIRCCFDKECKELRVQAMELVFSQQLFPEDFSVKERVKCWISFFSVFDENDVKALERILQQKQRLHNEMQNYLALQQKVEDEKADEIAKSLLLCCKNMGLSFMDSTYAESELHALSQLKDEKVLKYLGDLLDPNTTDSQACTLRKNLLQQIDDQHPRHEFLKILTVKCSYTLFGKEHMLALVTYLDDFKKQGDEKLLKASMGLLVAFARHFPSLLEGLEENIMELLKDDREFLREGSVQIFGCLRGQLTEDSSSVDLLEKLCVEGNRKQVKYAVKALAAISGDSGLKIFSTLYRKLLDLLDSGTNLPTILQSLGCIAQYDASVFETSEEVLVNFLTKDLFKRESVDTLNEECGSVSETTFLKIFGLKALVKSFLPRKEDQIVPRFKGLSGILLKFVECGEVSEDIKSRRIDKDQLRLAAGKSVLLLSKRYDIQISAQLFHAVVLLSMDSCDFVKNGFLCKLRKLLKKQAVPEKYACALALSLSGNADNDFLAEVTQELSSFVEISRREARLRDITVSGQGEDDTIIHCPEYVLFYLVHALAQVADFPSLSEGGPSIEKLNPFFKQISVYVWALLNSGQGKLEHDAVEDVLNYAPILSIFRKMKVANDKLDAMKTENTRILCDIGIAIVKDLAEVEIPEYKYADKIPLPVLIYEAPENEEETNKVDGSHLPVILKDADAFSQLKSSQSFLVDLISKKRKRTASEDASEEDKSSGKLGKADDISVDGDRQPRKQARTSEEEDQDVCPSPVTDEIAKDSDSERSPSEKNRLSDDDTKFETVGSSSKRGRGGRLLKEKNTMQKHTTAKPSSNVSMSAETDIDEHETPLATGSSRKSVKISIKSPKPPEEEVSDEDSVEAKRPASKQVETKKPLAKDSSAEAKRTRGKKDADVHGLDTQAMGSPKDTPRRSAKKRADSKPDKNLEPKDLVGCRIEVWWPLDKRYYSGMIEKYDAKLKTHKVVYDDGDVEILRLEKERWRLLEDTDDELGSPSTPVSSELGMQSKRRNTTSQTKRKSKGGSSSKRPLESSNKRSIRQSKQGEDGSPKQLRTDLEKLDAEEEASHHNANAVAEESARGQTSDREKTPPTVSKVQAKSSGQSGKRPIGRPRKHFKDNAVKAREITQEDVPLSTDSKDSKDSDDVPLDEWKSSRKKARLQE